MLRIYYFLIKRKQLFGQPNIFVKRFLPRFVYFVTDIYSKEKLFSF